MTALFVAANGGHLAQLVDLAPRIATSGARLWVTPDGPQAESLLKGEQRIAPPEVKERDLRGVLRTTSFARRLFNQYDVDLVVSTGSGVALGFLPLAAARRIPAVFIESATFVNRMSVTGKVLRYVPRVRLYTQHESRAGGRWHYCGSVFDGFRAEPIDVPAKLERVVVTLGSDRWPFRPVVERLAPLLPRGADVIWQTGPTDVSGLGITPVNYLPAAELETAIRECDVVVAHAGCGSALMALKAGKVPLLVPRDAGRGEVYDDHQRTFAQGLAARGLATVAEVGELTGDHLWEAAGQRAVLAGPLPPLQLHTAR